MTGAPYTVCAGIRARHELLVLAFVILEAVSEGRDGTQDLISFHLEPRPASPMSSGRDNLCGFVEANLG